jgi:formate dehydrogenase subunit beta
MANVEDSIRKIAQKLLSEKKVALIIGYEQGTLPLRTTPCFVSKAEDVSELVWNASCDANLSKYLVGREDKVGIVAKGCDARAIVVCTVEKQIPRENLFIIGVPCLGVIDRKKVEAKLDGREALDAIIEDEEIKVRGEGFEYVLPREDFICDSCLTCKHRNPPIYDVLVGEKASEAPHAAEFAGVSSLESKSAEERWAHFEEELGKCIRCYACRNVCPLCYCRECFVDQTMPAWFGKTNHISDIMIYHIVRAFHVAGRCVDCGACSRACPMDIDLRQLVKKTEQIVRERFDYEAGISLEEVPPLGEFKMQDPQEFIR